MNIKINNKKDEKIERGGLFLDDNNDLFLVCANGNKCDYYQIVCVTSNYISCVNDKEYNLENMSISEAINFLNNEFRDSQMIKYFSPNSYNLELNI